MFIWVFSLVNDFQIELCVSYCSTLFLLIYRLTRYLFYFSLLHLSLICLRKLGHVYMFHLSALVTKTISGRWVALNNIIWMFSIVIHNFFTFLMSVLLFFYDSNKPFLFFWENVSYYFYLYLKKKNPLLDFIYCIILSCSMNFIPLKQWSLNVIYL